jgi:hypothetical protein
LSQAFRFAASATKSAAKFSRGGWDVREKVRISAASGKAAIGTPRRFAAKFAANVIRPFLAPRSDAEQCHPITAILAPPISLRARDRQKFR